MINEKFEKIIEQARHDNELLRGPEDLEDIEVLYFQCKGDLQKISFFLHNNDHMHGLLDNKVFCKQLNSELKNDRAYLFFLKLFLSDFYKIHREVNLLIDVLYKVQEPDFLLAKQLVHIAIRYICETETFLNKIKFREIDINYGEVSSLEDSLEEAYEAIIKSYENSEAEKVGNSLPHKDFCMDKAYAEAKSYQEFKEDVDFE
tara:strand:- start:746 stop:1354 length:609 start_codon:yes stop_codon:yes gene_type:complete